MQDEEHSNECQHAQRNLPKKRPPPTNRIRQDTTHRSSRCRPESSNNIEVTLPLAPLPQRYNIGQQDGYHRRHASRSHPSQRSRSNQLPHNPREPGSQAAEPKDYIREQQTCLAPEDIAKLPIQRLESRQSEEVSRSDPRGRAERVELRANASVAGDGDGLVGGGEEDSDGDGGDDVGKAFLEIREAFVVGGGVLLVGLVFESSGVGVFGHGDVGGYVSFPGVFSMLCLALVFAADYGVGWS